MALPTQQNFVDIEVHVLSKDSVEVMGQRIVLQELDSRLISALNQNPMVYRIVLQSSSEIDYSTYSSVFKTLRKSIDHCRNMAAQDRFGLVYNDLSAAKRNEIRMLFPYRWKEETIR